MPTLARIDEVCGLVADAINGSTVAGDHTLAVADSMADIADVEDIRAFDNRRVFVMPAAFSQIETSSRARDLNEYRASLFVVDWFRDPDSTGKTYTEAWRRDQTLFVETLYDFLANIRSPRPIAGFFTQTLDVAEVYSIPLLREHGIYWSELEIALRKHE